MTVPLMELGWDAVFEEAFAPFSSNGFSPGRIISQHRTGYGLLAPGGEFFADVTGRLAHMALNPSDLPVVGDWVVAVLRPAERTATITEILPRRTWLSRQSAGEKTAEQVIAANLDIVFIVTDLGQDYNPRRLERYLTLISTGGAVPIILLNKSDLAEDVEDRLADCRALFNGIEIHALSALHGHGVEIVRERIRQDLTGALVGSSGVGKTTLINQLIGSDLLETREVRLGDGKGRHTTSRRELYMLPEGGMLIDTPGMREVQLWADEEGLSGSFPEIEELGSMCRFRDCRHDSEPDCAVLAAVDAGKIPIERLLSYRKQQKEIDWHLRRSDPAAREEENKRIARLVKEVKRMKKRR
jgi:ribosome biogenesis GTPase